MERNGMDAPAPEGNAQIVRVLLEAVLGRGEYHLLPELIAPDYVAHLPIGDHYGPEGARIDFAAFRAALPDLTLQIDELVDSGDRVMRRYAIRGTQTGALLGHPPTGQPLEMRVSAIDRLANGRLVESWVTICGERAISG